MMRLDEKDTDRLLKILDYCDEVEATIAYFGDDYEKILKKVIL